MSLWLPATPTEADVVIIGGGIAGVSVAYHLAKAGVEVVLFEAGQISGRASGRNDGQLLLGLGEHYNRIVSQFGPDKARILWDFIEQNNRQLKNLARPMREAWLCERHGVRMAETPQEFAELTEAAELLNNEGRACALMSQEALERLLPVRNYHGALMIGGEAIVQPAAMTKGIAKLATQSGAEIICHTEVVDITQRDDGRHVVTTSNGARTVAYMVVHCTSALAPTLDKSGFLSSQIFPYRGQIIATNPLDEVIVKPFDGFAMSSNFCYEYFRTYRNRFVIGGMRWSVKGQEEHTTRDDITNPEITQNLLGYVSKHFPTLDGVEFPQCWTGIMAGTNDGLPLVGPIPGQTGVLVLLAFNGYGLSFAYKAAEIIKDYVVDGKPQDESAAMFNPRRFIND